MQSRSGLRFGTFAVKNDVYSILLNNQESLPLANPEGMASPVAKAQSILKMNLMRLCAFA